MWKPFASWVWLAAVVAVSVVAACSGDETAPVSRPQPQATESAAQEDLQQQPAEQSASQTEDAEPTASSVEEAANEEEREDLPQEEQTQEAPAQSTTAQVEEEEEEPAEGLTDIPGVVLADADVRIRPGLAWPTVDRLTAGESVLVLHGGGGWYRISYRDGHEGWIRSTAVDWGEIDERSVLRQAAPPLIGEWRGIEYGVMGQSADGAEVRLLAGDDEQSEILGAPKDEVTLFADDVTLDDLPILIGDETVVFPGSDFRAGQGRILPKANEWMWLPWGWLLAHNDEYIWQWRPGTDELEFVRRPPGYAGFSPGGESLAILTCGGEESCFPYLDVSILPLDGTPMVTLMDHAEVNQSLGALKAISVLWCNDIGCEEFIWTSDERGLLIPLVPEAAVLASAAALLHADKQMVMFDPRSLSSILPGHCRPSPRPSGYGWRLNSKDLVEFAIECVEDEHELTWHTASYDSSGRAIAVGPRYSFDRQDLNWDEALISADKGNFLGDGFRALRDETDRIVLVAAPQRKHLLIYEVNEGHLRPIVDNNRAIPDWFWESAMLGWDSWDTYWSGHGQAAVVARYSSTHAAGVLLIDLASGIGEPLELGSVRTWPCFPTGGWSPDGTIFQIEFEASSSYERLEGLWIDGIAASHGRIAQRQFVNSHGEAVGLLRAVAHLRFSAPSHLAGWSADGDWLAIGGHQNRHHCW